MSNIGTNKEVNIDEIEFGKLGKIEINFAEMCRQRDKIEELKISMTDSMTSLISAIRSLASLVGAESSCANLASLPSKVSLNFKTVFTAMNKQLNDYSGLNEITKKQISDLVDKLVDANSFVSYIDENGNEIDGLTYGQMLKRVGLSYTPTEQYDMTNLREFVGIYEGTTEVKYIDGVKYYRKQWDVNGWAVGPGVHLEHIGEYTSPNPEYVPADVVDAAVDKLLSNIRTNIETSISNNVNYSNLNLTDNQIDSLTSLLYNTGKNPEYFLDRYVGASASDISLYDYSTKYWVNAGGVRYDGLVIRRAGEHVLAEYGYDAWKEWNQEHYYGTSSYNLGLDNL